jgi:phospholipase A1
MERDTLIKRYAALLLLLLSATPRIEAAENKEPTSAIDRRIEFEWQTHDNPFVITPHRPTYLLPMAYNARLNNAPYEDAEPGLAAKHGEIKFQFSFKVPLIKGLLFGKGMMSFGYTQQSYWQAYNGNYSSPFRETNHEPEMLITFPTDYRVMGMRGRMMALSFNHQSNGRSEPLSRSWNRVMLEMVLERDDLYISLKPWWRIPENEETDDNPDIEDYLGHFELRALQRYRDHSLGLMLRNNLQEDNRGAIQMDYTFPIKKRLNGYVQLFSGYGESLIDYDHYSNRIGVGIMLTNWL